MTNINLPRDYKDYLARESPTHGFTDLDFVGYFILWLLDDIDDLNRQYKLNNYAPGFLAFGSDGGGELLVFDMNGAIFAMPAIGMSSDVAIEIAESWSYFYSHIAVDSAGNWMLDAPVYP
ncbi:MAG: SMI1/KNR4 family protein [Cyanobacteria bacterium P01_E01_bin.45]